MDIEPLGLSSSSHSTKTKVGGVPGHAPALDAEYNAIPLSVIAPPPVPGAVSI